MKKQTFLLFVAMLFSVTWTFGQQRIEKTDYQESSARNLEPEQSVMIAPMIADMEVISGKIYYTETEAFSNYPVTPAIVQLVPEFKKIALSRAARAYKADVIIGATVDVITNAAGRLEITISGYPACYTNFRNATSEDMNLVQEGLNLMKQNNTDILSTPTDQTRLNVEITK